MIGQALTGQAAFRRTPHLRRRRTSGGSGRRMRPRDSTTIGAEAPHLDEWISRRSPDA
ncbi:hypothetical protein SNL152K_6425 [Streptomyces sp. NL15-2K]|nr:hypothetical protein SNL152K_6425 [Streptomyces sp. NL15-2K]